jgi:hypothetical protein
MGDPLPMACSLTAEQLPQRLAEVGELGRSALIDAAIAGGRAELQFTGGTDNRAAIDRFVAAESACCPFFSFDVRDEDEVIHMIVEAPPEGAEILQILVQEFTAGQAGGSRPPAV